MIHQAKFCIFVFDILDDHIFKVFLSFTFWILHVFNTKVVINFLYICYVSG